MGLCPPLVLTDLEAGSPRWTQSYKVTQTLGDLCIVNPNAHACTHAYTTMLIHGPNRGHSGPPESIRRCPGVSRVLSGHFSGIVLPLLGICTARAWHCSEIVRKLLGHRLGIA